jgi:hypothetical protein
VVRRQGFKRRNRGFTMRRSKFLSKLAKPSVLSWNIGQSDR